MAVNSVSRQPTLESGMKINATTRRQFISRTTSAVAAFTIVPRHVLGGAGFVPPSEKVNIALVGAGGMGFSNLRALMQLEDAQVIAVVDPATSYTPARGDGRPCGRKPARAAIEKHHSEKTPNFRCAEYEDFRVMLEREKAVDAVLCATPDHLHAHVSTFSMRAGKHIYCEKPLAHNIWETRYLARLARETGLATQMGNQGQSSEGIRQTVEYLQDGAIGTVREIHVWPRWGRYNPGLTKWPEAGRPVPAGMNWDLWLGPREPRPFHPAYAPYSWRDFWAFGGGPLADFACHDMNAAFWAFDLQTPTRVQACSTGSIHADVTEPGAIIYYEFPVSGRQAALPLTWYHGGLKPAAPEALGNFPMPDRGTLFVGDKGVIQTSSSGSAPRLFPESRRASYRKPDPILPRSNGHHRDWLDACKGGPPAGSNFERGARLTELAHIGTLALRTRRIIEWDAQNMRAKGVPEADAFIRESYRKGWEIA